MRSKIYNWFLSPRQLVGASILRIILGIIIMYTYVIHYPLRRYLWTDDGIINNSLYVELNRIPISVYGLSDSIVTFEILYHLGFLFAFLFTIGFGGKLIQILCYIFIFSLNNRNGLITDGGDNLMHLVLFYMIFMNVTTHFAIKTKILEDNRSFITRIKERFKDKLTIIHNFSVIFVIVQLCFLYFMAGTYQIMGEKWMNGTAIYYIMQVEQYSTQLLPDFLLKNSLFLVIITYFSIVIKIAFPFSLFNRYMKYLAISGIIIFHLGIGIAMGLITFSAIMIAIDSLILNDQEYQAMYSKGRELKAKITSYVNIKRYREGLK